jgi:hypothetical protein
MYSQQPRVGWGMSLFFFPMLKKGPNFGVVKLLSREHAVHGIDTINVVTYLFFFYETGRVLKPLLEFY